MGATHTTRRKTPLAAKPVCTLTLNLQVLAGVPRQGQCAPKWQWQQTFGTSHKPKCGQCLKMGVAMCNQIWSVPGNRFLNSGGGGSSRNQWQQPGGQQQLQTSVVLEIGRRTMATVAAAVTVAAAAAAPRENSR